MGINQLTELGLKMKSNSRLVRVLKLLVELGSDSVNKKVMELSLVLN